jgi:hypothetical protein
MIEMRLSQTDDFAPILQATTQESFGGTEVMDFALQHLDIFSYTWTLNEEPIAAAGIQVLWEGVGRAWAIFTPAVLGHGITLARDVKMCLESIESERSLHRIEMDILIDEYSHQRFAQWLGFQKESVMVGYGPSPGKNDYFRYVRHRWPN